MKDSCVLSSEWIKREFLVLLEKFTLLFQKTSYKRNRKRRLDAGKKHTLRILEQKLFYIKCYPTYGLSAFFFGVNRSHTR